MANGTSAPVTSGFTIQLYVPAQATAAAREYYVDLFGREPDFQPHDDFFEWAPVDGQECWVQVAAHPEPSPLTNRIRFRVLDLQAAVAFLDDRAIVHSQPSQLPGVVAFVNFTDPWHNRLGYYQDLVPSGLQQEHLGTSVNDASQFTSVPGVSDS
ncbi:VOC family protein [Ruania albidiflava]|uniref:VOC family protein n=1 Tax=Ruania albidiflava TaxID=366586 RepID=UPI0003B5FC0D|nr:glyoxalase/bleomycin resistance/dioxygenase family protein [Ruania albidiflava]